MNRRKTLKQSLLMALPLLAAPLLAQAAISPTTLPANGSVVSGTVTASVSGSTLNLNLGSSQAVIDWGSAGGSLNPVSGTGGFDVGSQASVTFAGGQSGGSVLNIDVSGQPSTIDGTILGGDVGVYVANANGVIVGPNAVVSAPTVALMANGETTAESLFNGGSFSPSGQATGALNIAQGAAINAGNVILAGNGDVNIGNSIGASTIDLYGEADLTGSLNASKANVAGGFYSTGSITANDLNVNLTHYVNDNKTGQILANGFTLDAGSSGTMNITLTADGTQAQGFNVFVNGNAAINSGDTTVSVNSPNTNSRLILKASGNLTVNPGTETNPYESSPAFLFPGLLYLEGWQSNTVNADLVNAYSAAAPVGYGVFVISPVINDSYSVYANGSRGVNFEGRYNGTGYNPAQSINGSNPSTSNFSFTIPIYFASQASGGLSLTQAKMINNPSTGYSQPNDLFLGNVPNLVAQATQTTTTTTETPTSTANSSLEQLALEDAIVDTSDGQLTANSPEFQAGFPAVESGVSVLGGYGILPGNGVYDSFVAIIVTAVVQGYETGNSGSALNNIAVATAQSLGQSYMQALGS